MTSISIYIIDNCEICYFLTTVYSTLLFYYLLFEHNIRKPYYSKMHKKLDQGRYLTTYNTNQQNDHLINEMPLNDLQHCELNILKSFIAICNQYKLQYYLAGGTLLGAVRHGGFIPWDDDIDVIMPRRDYDRFIELAPGYDSSFELLNCHTDSGFIELFTKYMDSNTAAIYYNVIPLRRKFGICIDIFPLDTSPAFWFSYSLLHLQEKVLGHCISYLFAKKTMHNKRGFSLKMMVKGAMVFFLYHNSSLNDVVIMKENLIKSYCKKETGFVCNYAGHHIVLPKSVFGNGITMYFEGIPVVVPSRYEVWLEKLYGPDYMKIPPINEQILKHENEFDILDLEHSYHTYFDDEGNLL